MHSIQNIIDNVSGTRYRETTALQDTISHGDGVSSPAVHDQPSDAKMYLEEHGQRKGRHPMRTGSSKRREGAYRIKEFLEVPKDLKNGEPSNDILFLVESTSESFSQGGFPFQGTVPKPSSALIPGVQTGPSTPTPETVQKGSRGYGSIPAIRLEEQNDKGD